MNPTVDVLKDILVVLVKINSALERIIRLMIKEGEL